MLSFLIELHLVLGPFAFRIQVSFNRTTLMKKYLLLLFTISFLFLSCAKEEKTKTSFMLDTSGLYQEMIEMEGEEIQAVLMGKTKTGSFYFSQVLTNSVNIEKEIPS